MLCRADLVHRITHGPVRAGEGAVQLRTVGHAALSIDLLAHQATRQLTALASHHIEFRNNPRRARERESFRLV